MTRAQGSSPSAQAGVERLQSAAAKLTPLEREVLVLSAGLGLRNNEIGEMLGLGERRVERVLARALRKFDRALRGEVRSWRQFW